MKVLYLFIITTVLLILYSIFAIKEKFTPVYMNHKASCFDCERQMLDMYGPDEVYKAQPSKSFDAESQDGYLGKTLKYY